MFYLHNTKTVRKTTQDIENDVNLLNKSIYYFDENNKPQRDTLMNVYDLLANAYNFYSFDANSQRPELLALEDALPDSWAVKMLADYMQKHPEQAIWFNTIEVDTIKERNNLKGRIPAESWVYVKDDGTGQSREYVLSADKEFWVDSRITDRNISSGKESMMELYARLQSGYLYDTFGPNGQNKEECDFVWTFFVFDRGDRELFERTWNKSGDVLRWDFGNGDVVSFNGIPDFTLNGSIVATCSAEDSLKEIGNLGFADGFTAEPIYGSIPRVDTSATTDMMAFIPFFMAGRVPPIETSQATDFYYFCNVWTITSLPDLDFRNGTRVTDAFTRTLSLRKIGKIQLGSPDNLFGLFRGSNLPPEQFKHITISGDTGINGASLLLESRNKIPRISNDTFGFDLENLTGLAGTFGECHIGKFDLDLSNIDNMEDMLRNTIVEKGSIRGLDNIVIDSETCLQILGYSRTSSGMWESYVKELYDNRLAHKQNSDGISENNTILIDLTAIKRSRPLSGEYKNVEVPSKTNHYLYKLVENPDNEDILNYYIVEDNSQRNSDGVSEVTLQVNQNDEIEFGVAIQHTLPFRQEITVNWGDGSPEEVIDLETAPPTARFTFSHVYEKSGTYTLQIGGTDNDTSMSDIIKNDIDPEKIIGITYGVGCSVGFFDYPRNMPNLEEIKFKGKVTVGYWLRNAFRNCPKLKHIDPIYVFIEPSGIATNMLVDSTDLESAEFINLQRSFNISNAKFSGEALNKLFEGLGTVDSATVTVTGNSGVNDNVYDPSIATNKGWTVVDS